MLPGLTSVLHPGPVSRLGNENGSLLFCPTTSPESISLKGWPSWAVKMVPISHPPNRFSPTTEDILGFGKSHVMLATRTRGVLKSASDLFSRKSYQCRLLKALAKASAPAPVELSS